MELRCLQEQAAKEEDSEVLGKGRQETRENRVFTNKAARIVFCMLAFHPL